MLVSYLLASASAALKCSARACYLASAASIAFLLVLLTSRALSWAFCSAASSCSFRIAACAAATLVFSWERFILSASYFYYKSRIAFLSSLAYFFIASTADLCSSLTAWSAWLSFNLASSRALWISSADSISAWRLNLVFVVYPSRVLIALVGLTSSSVD